MLNKDEILKRTNNGLDIFKYYIPGQWRIGRNFLNPLYEDRKASCNVYFDRRNNCYRLKDFGNDTYSGDCFDIVGKLKGLDCGNPKDFIEILEIINNDMYLGFYNDNSPLDVSVLFNPIKESKSTLNQQSKINKKSKALKIKNLQRFAV